MMYLIWAILLLLPLRGVQAALDDIGAVYIGAHPDDIDIAMLPSLYKYDYGVHPILWVVVTDGAADQREYDYEVAKGWIASDGVINETWLDPDGNVITRPFASGNLADARVGWHLNYRGEMQRTESSHTAMYASEFSPAYDLESRVSMNLPDGVTCVFLRYQAAYAGRDPWLQYPDGAQVVSESSYTESLTYLIARAIDRWMKSLDLRRELLFMNAHAPEEIAFNSWEHPDHGITGNAARQAVDILESTYEVETIHASWYTVYSPIEPKSPYTRNTIDIVPQLTLMREYNMQVWEADWMFYIGWQPNNYLYAPYPTGPFSPLYNVEVTY